MKQNNLSTTSFFSLCILNFHCCVRHVIERQKESSRLMIISTWCLTYMDITIIMMVRLSLSAPSIPEFSRPSRSSDREACQDIFLFILFLNKFNLLMHLHCTRFMKTYYHLLELAKQPALLLGPFRATRFGVLSRPFFFSKSMHTLTLIIRAVGALRLHVKIQVGFFNPASLPVPSLCHSALSHFPIQ